MSKRGNCSCKKNYKGWVHVSASQIKTFRDCNRKMAFDKIDKVPRTSSAGAEFGTLVHTEAENYFGPKKTPPAKTAAGETFKQGLGVKNFLPPWSPTLEVEKHLVIELPGLDKVLIHGYIDLRGHRLVCDHKYTKDRKWIPTLEELAKDPQVLIYAVSELLEQDLQGEVETRWLYYVTNATRTKPKGTAVRSLTHTADSIAAGFERIIVDAEAIAHVRRTAKKANDVNHNPAACQKFGGCEYRHLCKREGAKASAYIAQDDRFRADKETLTKLNTGEK